MKWYRTIIGGARVLFNGDARSREELEELAVQVRRQRPRRDPDHAANRQGLSLGVISARATPHPRHDFMTLGMIIA
jgi:hypothetical protein